MNKKYILVSIVACFSLLSHAQDITDDADIKIEGISSVDASSFGVLHNGGGSKNSINLIIPDYSGISGARPVQFQTVSCQCFDQNSGVSNIDAAYFMNDESGYQSVNYPYIQIEPADGTEITHVAFKGFNGNAGIDYIYMSYGFSSGTGTSLGDDDFTAIPYMEFPITIYDGMYMGRNENACVLTQLQMSQTEKIPVPSDKQTIRMAASKLFPTGVPLTGNAVKPWNIVGIYVWTNGIPSSINNPGGNSFQVFVADDILNLTKPANVSLYNISGALIISAQNVQALPLNSLSSGIYVIKAIEASGEIVTKKIVK